MDPRGTRRCLRGVNLDSVNGRGDDGKNGDDKEKFHGWCTVERWTSGKGKGDKSSLDCCCWAVFMYVITAAHWFWSLMEQRSRPLGPHCEHPTKVRCVRLARRLSCPLSFKVTRIIVGWRSVSLILSRTSDPVSPYYDRLFMQPHACMPGSPDLVIRIVISNQRTLCRSG